MKYLPNISEFLKKLLFIVIAVSFLSACGENEKMVADEEGILTQKCMGCNILELIYDAVGNNVSIMHKQFCDAALPIMMVGFSIWLALRLLKFVSSVTETNPGEVWNEIIRKAGVCLICGMLAGSPVTLNYVINSLVFPVYSAFMDLGLQIMQNSVGTDDNPTIIKVFGEEIKAGNSNDLKCELNGELKLSDKGGFPASIRQAMSCMISALNQYLNIGGEIAIKSMNQTRKFMGKVTGFTLFIFFFLVRIGFVFYLVDTIFKMGIMILLLPLFILSYAFEPTRKWTGIGFSNILASAGFMMCFSIIVAIVLMAMVALINGNGDIFDPGGSPEVAEAHMRDISIGFLCLLIIGFLVYGSMGVAQQLTSALIGIGPSGEFQKKLKATIQGIGSAIVSGISALVSEGVASMPDGGFKLIKAIKRAQALRNKLQRFAGRD